MKWAIARQAEAEREKRAKIIADEGLTLGKPAVIDGRGRTIEVSV